MSRKLGTPGHEPGESGPARRDYLRRRADEQNATAFSTQPTTPAQIPATDLVVIRADNLAYLAGVKDGRAEAGHRTTDDHDCFLMNCARLGDEVSRMLALLATVEAAARAEALVELIEAVRKGWLDGWETGSDEAKAPGESTGFERGMAHADRLITAVLDRLALLPAPPR